MVVVSLCGEGFVSLTKHPNEWVWTAVGEDRFGTFFEVRGKTALEAAENLMINLTEVDTPLLLEV